MNELMPDTADEGLMTLQAIAQAGSFNKWMYDTIRPFCKGRILEIGSGIGNISDFFIADKANILLSDVRPAYCDYLRGRYAGSANVQGVMTIDLAHPQFETAYAQLLNNFDTVFALNVVEHISDDDRAIGNAASLLAPGGNLVILVPAYQWLYNRFDRELHHYRRYTRKSLVSLMSPHARVVHSQYFNLPAIPGWFVSGRLFNRKTIKGWQMKLFNGLVPVFRVMDRLVQNKLGISVIAVASR